MGTGYGVLLSVIGWGEREMSLWGLMWIMEPGIMLLVEWVMLPLDPDYLSGVFCCNQCTRLPPAFIPTKAPSHPSLPPKPTRGIHQAIDSSNDEYLPSLSTTIVVLRLAIGFCLRTKTRTVSNNHIKMCSQSSSYLKLHYSIELLYH